MYVRIKIKKEWYNIHYELYLKDNVNQSINNEVIPIDSPIVFLHGWGMSLTTFSSLYPSLTNYNILSVDFPGFGESDEPKEVFSLDEFVEMIHQLLFYLHIENPILLGHSFGGRVAIKYSLKYSCQKMILVDSAGIRYRDFSITKKIISYKIKKVWYHLFSLEKYLKLIKNSGSEDYRKLNDIMKQTMSKIVHEDLKNLLPKINSETILLWGINDKTTPIKDAKIMQELLPQSRLILFYQSGHFPYLDEEKKFIQVLKEVL